MEILKEQYEKEVIPALMKKFNYKSIMEVPKLEKIVINIGLGDTKDNPKSLENAKNDLSNKRRNKYWLQGYIKKRKNV